MKICPVCNESFADQLNFCDVDGARLKGEDSGQARNRLWSFLGAGLLVGALVISAASIIFLPKARVAAPLVTSEPQPTPVTPKAQPPETVAAVNPPAASGEPETASSDALVPEKKKDKSLTNSNASGPAPNPKAAATASDEADKKLQPTETPPPPPPPAKRPETIPSVKPESHSIDSSSKSQPPADLKRDPKSQPTVAKGSDKESSDKKKNDDKDKKKGGFLRVFKKIFGKD